MQPELIHHLLLKKVDLTNLKSGVDKLDIDKLKSLPTYLNNLKRRGDKLDFDKLVPVPVDLSKQSDVVKMLLLKRCLYGKIKILKIQYLILLTWLLLVLLLLLKIKYLVLVI